MERFKKWLTFAVLSIHSLILLVIVCLPPSIPSKKPVVVKTVIQSYSQPIAAPTIQQTPQKNPIRHQTETRPLNSQQKKPPTPAPTSKREVKKIPIKKSEPLIPSSLLQELEEGIAKIESLSPLPKEKQGKGSIPALNPLQCDTITPSKKENVQDSTSYTDLLVNTMRSMLSLPEYGEVKLQLTLRQDGTVVKIVVLNSQSKQNARYLEMILPSVVFPKFGNGPNTDQEQTFLLTFCNG